MPGVVHKAYDKYEKEPSGGWMVALLMDMSFLWDKSIGFVCHFLQDVNVFSPFLRFFYCFQPFALTLLSWISTFPYLWEISFSR